MKSPKHINLRLCLFVCFTTNCNQLQSLQSGSCPGADSAGCSSAPGGVIFAKENRRKQIPAPGGSTWRGQGHRGRCKFVGADVLFSTDGHSVRAERLPSHPQRDEQAFSVSAPDLQRDSGGRRAGEAEPNDAVPWGQRCQDESVLGTLDMFDLEVGWLFLSTHVHFYVNAA